MSTKKNKGNLQSGFSLVELMVVVAIIGVLATIAVPRVNRFVAKSRQSEAQIQLSSIYTFNKNFYTEFQGYTTSLGGMGYAPEGNLRYIAGFTQAATAPASYTLVKQNLPAAVDTITLCPNTAAVGAERCRTLNGANNALPASTNLPPTTISADFQDFIAGAASCLVSAAGACTFDQWTINQSKTIRQIQDGILND